MAKKSTATRNSHSTAQRRPQTSKTPDVALVRTPRPGGEQKAATPATVSASASDARASGAKTAPKPTSKPAAAPVLERSKAIEAAKPKPKPAGATGASTSTSASKPRQQVQAQPKPQAGGSAAARAQAARVARVKSLQRARAANYVTPEHYSYVPRDLRLIGIMAVLMFATLIVLHFVLPQ